MDQTGTKGVIMDDPDISRRLEAGFQNLQEAQDCNSLIKKHLTKPVFDKLKRLKTPTYGSTLLDVIRSGIKYFDSEVGVYAPDPEAYKVFEDLFDPVIDEYHLGFSKRDKQPSTYWGNVNSLANLDLTGDYVDSIKISCCRSFKDLPFSPSLTEAQFVALEDKMIEIFPSLTSDEFKGTYYPLSEISSMDMDEIRERLIKDGHLFKIGDRFLQGANACRFWPNGRGTFLNDKKNFLVWVNEKDHLKIISFEDGGDLASICRRMVAGVSEIEKNQKSEFAYSERLGWLTCCPTNLGTGICVSVKIKLPKLAKNEENFGQ